MPYQRPGNAFYAVNGSGGIYLHDQPVVETVGTGQYVGIAVKQRAAHWSDGLAAQNQIQASEPYLILRRGVVQVANNATFADGDKVYITTANVLSKSGTGSNVKFGRVVEVPADGRGVPVGMVRINLDERETF